MINVLGSDFEGGFVARGTFLLKQLPFIELDFSDIRQKKIHDSIVEITKQVREICFQLEYNIDKATKKVLENEKRRLITRIETLITKVYKQSF